MFPSPSSLSTLLGSSVHTLVVFNLLYLPLDSCTVIFSYLQPGSLRAPRAFSISSSHTPLCPSLFLSIPHLHGHTGVKQNADSGCRMRTVGEVTVSAQFADTMLSTGGVPEIHFYTLSLSHRAVYLSVSPSSKAFCQCCYFCHSHFIFKV